MSERDRLDEKRGGFVHTFGVAKYVYLADYERLEKKAEALVERIKKWRDSLPSSSTYDGTRREYDKAIAGYRAEGGGDG